MHRLLLESKKISTFEELIGLDGLYHLFRKEFHQLRRITGRCERLNVELKIWAKKIFKSNLWLLIEKFDFNKKTLQTLIFLETTSYLYSDGKFYEI